MLSLLGHPLSQDWRACEAGFDFDKSDDVSLRGSIARSCDEGEGQEGGEIKGEANTDAGEGELDDPACVAGIGCGWIDNDDEDAFDAALFFSALDAGSDDTSPMPAILVHPDSQMDEDATEDDDEMSWDEENESAQGVSEVTHAWDGSVAFTNGFNDGQCLLDWAFEGEAAAAILSVSSSSSPAPEPMQHPSFALTLDFLVLAPACFRCLRPPPRRTRISMPPATWRRPRSPNRRPMSLFRPPKHTLAYARLDRLQWYTLWTLRLALLSRNPLSPLSLSSGVFPTITSPNEPHSKPTHLELTPRSSQPVKTIMKARAT